MKISAAGQGLQHLVVAVSPGAEARGTVALHVASLGLPVLGVDVAETALAIAREKAKERGIEVEFAAADAFQLERLGRRFETVLDCGLFHTFDGEERPGYVASLASVTEHDGTLYVLCFSDDGPRYWPAPHPAGRAKSGVQPQRWMECQLNPERDRKKVVVSYVDGLRGAGQRLEQCESTTGKF